MTDVLTVATGLAVGVLSGLIGIGGGVLLVPIMVLGFRVDQHLAQGTSLAAILPTSLVGALTHYQRGNLELRGATWMGLTGAALAACASIVALHLHAQLLARIQDS